MIRLTPKHVFWIKALFHLVGLAPIVYLFLLVASDGAGGDPVQYIIHYTGMGTINALVATMLVSPLAKRFKLAPLMQTRRLVGLYAFAYGTLHIMAFVSLDLLFAWGLLFEEILKRPYIIVGASGFLILFMLAITSPKFIQRKMGSNWQKLHNSVYILALLAPVHFYWSVKSEIIEPTFYIVGFAVLLTFRLLKSKRYKKVFRAAKVSGE